jgi:hypothetical protein
VTAAQTAGVDLLDTSAREKLFASLTPMEQLLSGYKDLKTPFLKLLQEGMARDQAIRNETLSLFTQQQSDAALAAEILIGTVQKSTEATARSNPASPAPSLSIIA